MKKVVAMLAADVSGSMKGNKLSDAKQALTDFTVQLPESARVGIVSFGGGGAKAVQAPTSKRGRIKRSVNKLSAAGGTPLHAGLKLSFQKIRQAAKKSKLANALTVLDGTNNKEASVKAIVLCTDGRPTMGPKKKGIVKLAEKVKQQGVRLVTVAIGKDADTGLLRKVASGEEDFHRAEFSGKLPGLYREIASGLVVKED